MTEILRVLDILVGVMFFHLPVGVMAWDRGVEGSTPLALRWRIRQSRAALGGSSGSPEAFWPIFSPLTPFFCVVILIVTKVAAWRSAPVAVAANKLQPQLKVMSSRRKGVLSDLDPVYSPGRRRNNYSIIIM